MENQHVQNDIRRKCHEYSDGIEHIVGGGTDMVQTYYTTRPTLAVR